MSDDLRDAKARLARLRAQERREIVSYQGCLKRALTRLRKAEAANDAPAITEIHKELRRLAAWRDEASSRWDDIITPVKTEVERLEPWTPDNDFPERSKPWLL